VCAARCPMLRMRSIGQRYNESRSFMASEKAPHLNTPAAANPPSSGMPPSPRHESRLPVVLTVLAMLVVPFVVSDRLSFGPVWLLPVLAGTLLIPIAIADHSRITGRSRLLRLLAIGLVVLLIFKSGWSTARLASDLLHNGPETNNATVLLLTGSLIWLGNNLVFALLYWELDSGGPAARANSVAPYPDLAFPGHLNPELVPPGWRPDFVDYLYLGLTTALAFSPTDVMPLARWAKLTMALQALISVVIITLVIARAVNILT
jgi:hypothetical protein